MITGLLDRFKQFITEDETCNIPIYAPITGKIVRIESVPDVVFSEKILGDGVAIKPISGQIVAPITGKITQLFETNHAFMIENDELEIFVHFGVGTTLKKTQFIRHCEVSDEVEVGDLILEVDLNSLLDENQSTVTPVIISSLDTITNITKLTGEVIAGKSPIMFVK